MCKTPFWTIAGAVLLSVHAFAGTARVRDVTTVEVIEVPVYVTSRDSAMEGLARENFELLVNGKPQAIDYFDVVDFDAVGGQAPDPRDRRLYLLLFDLDSRPRFTLDRARHAADRFVVEAGSANVFGVATIRGGRLDLVAPFTRDREAIRFALRNLDVKSSDPLHLAFQPRERTSGNLNGREVAGRHSDLEDGLEASMEGSLMAELEEEPSRLRIGGRLEVLERLAAQLASLAGHKHVIFFSTGFDTTVMVGGQRATAMADLQRGPMDFSDFMAPKDMLGIGAPRVSSRLLQGFERLAQRYARASVFLDAVDIAGVRSTLLDSGKDGLYLIAQSGQVVGNRNDLSQAIHDLTKKQQLVYVLGFHAPQTNRTSNAIRVRLRKVKGRPRLTYRRSYSTTRDTKSTELALADIVTNDIPQNGVSLLADVSVEAGNANVTISVPGRELSAYTEPQTMQLLTYVFSGTRVIAFGGKRVRVDPAHLEDERTYSFHENFAMPPGTYTAKVLLVMEGSEARGFVRRDFSIGD